MIMAGAIFFTLSCMSAVFIGAGWLMAWRLAPEQQRPQHLRWLITWSIKGLALPFLIWAIMNLGVSWSLQPFMPQVQAAQNSGGGWFSAFLGVLAAGLFLLSTYWSAATLVWALAQTRADLEGEARASFNDLCRTWLLGMGLPVLLLLGLGGLWTVGLAVFALVAPIAGTAPSITARPKLPPMYARAIARMKFGKYTEAEWEIIRQLEKHEDDFEGWMMLADLYANQFSDLPEAEQTILEICDQPRTTPSQLSLALHRLADWHLKVAGDPDAARRALQMICDRLRGTHLARMAQIRLNQLPATAQDLREAQVAQRIPLPALGDHLDTTPAEPEAEVDSAKAAQMANACVEKLKRDPNNVAARERLARIFAEQLQQADQGIEQIILLLDMPGQEDAKRAEWWGLVAAWHLKYRQDLDAGRKILERIIREFPHSPQARMAERRIRLLETELRQKAR